MLYSYSTNDVVDKGVYEIREKIGDTIFYAPVYSDTEKSWKERIDSDTTSFPYSSPKSFKFTFYILKKNGKRIMVSFLYGDCRYKFRTYYKSQYVISETDTSICVDVESAHSGLFTNGYSKYLGDTTINIESTNFKCLIFKEFHTRNSMHGPTSAHWVRDFSRTIYLEKTTLMLIKEKFIFYDDKKFEILSNSSKNDSYIILRSVIPSDSLRKHFKFERLDWDCIKKNEGS